MDCPNCSKTSPDAAIECSHCGVIFSKWKPKAERAEAPKGPSAPEGLSKESFWKLVSLGLFVVVLALVAFILTKLPEFKSISPEEAVSLRQRAAALAEQAKEQSRRLEEENRRAEAEAMWRPGIGRTPPPGSEAARALEKARQMEELSRAADSPEAEDDTEE